MRDGTDDVFGERAVTAVVAARDAKHRTVVTQVDLAAATEVARATGHRRVERHPLASHEALDPSPDPFDDTRGFVAHHQWWDTPARRSVIPMDVAAANAARPHAYQDIIVANLRCWHVDDRQFLVFGK